MIDYHKIGVLIAMSLDRTVSGSTYEDTKDSLTEEEVQIYLSIKEGIRNKGIAECDL